MELQQVAQTRTVQTNHYSEVNSPENGDAVVKESTPEKEPDYNVQLRN